MRFGLSAAAAAAVLYGAVVLFGLGPAFPVALGGSHDRSPSVVRVHAHDSAVSGPARRGPQPSAGPARPQAGPPTTVRPAPRPAPRSASRGRRHPSPPPPQPA